MLRLHPHGEQILADWWGSAVVTNNDRYLVASVLLSVVDNGWRKRWKSFDDLTDDTIKILEPRPGLKVIVRLWPGDAGVFDLIAVVSEHQ